MPEKDNSEFRYQISGNNSVIVVHFFGDMNSDAAVLIDRCVEEIFVHPHMKFVIFSFSSVTHIRGDAVQAFSQLQRRIRAKPAELKICSIKDAQKEKLSKLGVIRSSEIARTLREGIASISGVKTQAG